MYRKIIISIVSVAAIISIGALWIKFKAPQPAQSNPLDQILKDDNYPFNGLYSPESKGFGESELVERLNRLDTVKNHTENLEINILSEKMIKIKFKIKNLEDLVAANPQLADYKGWGKTLEGKTVSAEIGLKETNNGGIGIEIEDLSLGSIEVDPKMLSPYLEKTGVSAALSKIPYQSVRCECGTVTFLKGCPEFLQ